MEEWDGERKKRRSGVNAPFRNPIPKMQTRDKIPRKLRTGPVSARASHSLPALPAARFH